MPSRRSCTTTASARWAWTRRAAALRRASRTTQSTPALRQHARRPVRHLILLIPSPPLTCNPAVWLTEFGQAQDSTLNNATLANCLREFTIDHKIGWAVWSIAGSYYTRQGTQDLDDTWALLNHEWTDWRDEATIESCE